ncbi:ABC transporter substrate-binding protein [Micromonospora sp. AMSO31t]|uniref:ABC transporter substrate-binding protein n=1 Tax=Micromonospora sp. AMSO31t TaxID=2650566 RepID=UPI001CED676B|nr:ABC transporter substrate-binding protein [Micromonospora sp. AMSO31t]
MRARLVHGALGAIDAAAPDGVRYGVLEAIEVSDDLSTYTLHIRPDVAFTDGSTLTASDVLYSLRAPKLLNGLPFTQILTRNFDLDHARTEGSRTVVLPTARPIADGRLLMCQSMLAIKEGTTTFTADTPSCGPFTIGAFRPGQGTSLARNPTYFGPAIGETVTLDNIELLSIPDGQARVNALRGGQADFVSTIDPLTARTLAGDGRIAVTTSRPPFVSCLQFTMNPAFPPFADARVRRAFRLAVNRQAIVDSVYFGRALVGNDVPGLGFPTYHTGLAQRAYDPDEARSLLAAAGHGNLSVALTAGPELPGMVQTATLIVENLRAVGVNATLNELPPGQLFADYAAYTKLPFAAGYSPPALFEPNHVPGRFPQVDALVETARSARSAQERLAASHEAQRLLWEEGHQIVPVFVPTTDVQTRAVAGVRSLQFPDLSTATLAG